MDEGELVEWLQKQVGRRLPAEVLRRLRKDGYLHVEDDDERDEALVRAQFLLRFDVRESKRLKLPSEKALRTLAERDVQRCDAVSEYWARDAARQPDVRRFRKEILSGLLLTPAEARRFLTSPAALMFDADHLRGEGVDPARHDAMIVVEEATYRGPYRAVVEVLGPGVSLEFGRAASKSYLWDGERPLSPEELRVRVDDGRVVSVRPWLGSVVYDLRRVSETLERRRYPWREGDAAWFVLTGQTPIVMVVGHKLDWQIGSLGNRAVIKLEIEPWISVERVAYLYSVLQRRVLGGHNRPMSERRITLFRFITERTSDDGELPKWRALMDDWNRLHGKRWKYENVRNFSRDYWAAARGLLFPKYRFW